MSQSAIFQSCRERSSYYWVILHAFCRLLIIFKINFFTKKIFQKHYTIRVSNSLGPDQDRRFVGPDLAPNCLQRLSADYKHCS